MNENPSFVKPENLENLFQAITEQSGDGISLADTKGNYIFVNAAFSEITGCCETELLKMNVHDLLPPNVQSSLFPKVANRQSGYRETKLMKKNGSCFWAEIKGYPIDLKGRQLALGIIRDISKRKHYEKKLAENEEKFRILFDLSPLPISLSEMETGMIVDVNNKLCEYSKYSKNELIGKYTTEVGFLTVKDREKFTSALSMIGEVKGVEMDFRIKDGSSIHTLIFAKIIHIMNKRLIAMIIYDMTDRKRLEAQTRLIQRLETLSTLSGGLAHEINNSIQTVIGFSELLEMKLPDNDNVQMFCKKTKEPTRRITNLISQLLAYSRGGKYQTEPINMSHFVQTNLPLVTHEKLNDVNMEVSLAENIPDIKADANQLRMVLSEVLLNAIEAVQDRGNISIKTFEKKIDQSLSTNFPGLKPGTYACLIVKDNGNGMDKQTKSKIFEPFFTTKFHGRGLGMSAVYGIVKNHDGYVHVDSKPGKGSKVCVLMPLTQSPISS